MQPSIEPQLDRLLDKGDRDKGTEGQLIREAIYAIDSVPFEAAH